MNERKIFQKFGASIKEVIFIAEKDGVLFTITKKFCKRELVLQIPYRRIIEYLNVRTHHSFKSIGKKSQQTRCLIDQLWKKGYDFWDFKLVIDTKVNEWSKDPEFRKYLRPSTLFRTSKFEEYIQQGEEKSCPGCGSVLKGGVCGKCGYGKEWR